MNKFVFLISTCLVCLAFSANNRPFLVRRAIPGSYGYRYSDYLKFLSPDQRKHKLIIIGPNHMEVLFDQRSAQPFGFDQAGFVRPLNMAGFCRLLVARSNYFKTKFMHWHSQGLIIDSDLLRLAHDLGSKVPFGGE